MNITTDNFTPGSFLRLYHGRWDPNKQMNDWGFSGPVIPVVSVYGTYASALKYIPRGGRPMEVIRYHEDMLVYEGAYFGDFSVTRMETEGELAGLMRAHREWLREKARYEVERIAFEINGRSYTRDCNGWGYRWDELEEGQYVWPDEEQWEDVEPVLNHLSEATDILTKIASGCSNDPMVRRAQEFLQEIGVEV